jgi:hypothetical protein
VQLDNNALPFKEGSFDAITMRRGLCPCKGSTQTCGGIQLTRAATTSFLTEVATALNRNNPNAIAMLHADSAPPNGTTAQLRLWQRAARDVPRELGVEIEIMELEGKLTGIVIRPRAGD